jgi:FkbM family methyltransferase
MPAVRDRRVLEITAHGRSYRMEANVDPVAGKAAAKTTKLMQVGQPYERSLLEHIYHLGLAGTAVDVGANVGNHTLWLAAICRLWVVAFEPLVADQLKRNVELNDLVGRVEVHSAALGAKAGWARHATGGRLSRTGPDLTIPVLRLDDYDLAGVSVVKIDVEGMEAQVLRGAADTVERNRPVIFAEEWAEHPGWHDAIAEVLEPWGYRMTHLFTGRESPTPVGKWEHAG